MQRDLEAVTPWCAEIIWKKRQMCLNFASFPLLKWHRWWKVFLINDKNLPILHSWYHSCWWLGSASAWRWRLVRLFEVSKLSHARVMTVQIVRDWVGNIWLEQMKGQWRSNSYIIIISWKGVYWFHLVRLSICGQNCVRSVSSTVLVGSISYSHILSSNLRRCVVCNVCFKIQKFWQIL